MIGLLLISISTFCISAYTADRVHVVLRVAAASRVDHAASHRLRRSPEVAVAVEAKSHEEVARRVQSNANRDQDLVNVTRTNLVVVIAAYQRDRTEIAVVKDHDHVAEHQMVRLVLPKESRVLGE